LGNPLPGWLAARRRRLEARPATPHRRLGRGAQLPRCGRRRMSGGLEGRTVFVTGATGAIAEACATTLARDGATLALMARRAEGLAEVVARIEAAVPGAVIVPLVGDSTDEAAVAAALAEAHARTGRLDAAFATVGGGGFGPLA